MCCIAHLMVAASGGAKPPSSSGAGSGGSGGCSTGNGGCLAAAALLGGLLRCPGRFPGCARASGGGLPGGGCISWASSSLSDLTVIACST